MFLTGVISSFLSTIIGVTGSLISSVVQSFNLSKPEYISSCAFLLFTQHICKCILFGLMGFAFNEYILLIILVILSGILGTFAGKNIICFFCDTGERYLSMDDLFDPGTVLYEGYENGIDNQ